MVSAVTVSNVAEAANIAPAARRIGLGTEIFLSWMGGGRWAPAATWGLMASSFLSEVSTINPTPAYPFGHGLSYTPARWLDVAPRSGPEWPTDGSCQLSVTLRNQADRAASEVV